MTTIVGPAFLTLLFSAASSPGTFLPVGASWFCDAALLGAAILFGRAVEAQPVVEPHLVA